MAGMKRTDDFESQVVVMSKWANQAELSSYSLKIVDCRTVWPRSKHNFHFNLQLSILDIEILPRILRKQEKGSTRAAHSVNSTRLHQVRKMGGAALRFVQNKFTDTELLGKLRQLHNG